jgi:outer membrane immunogenic protein
MKKVLLAAALLIPSVASAADMPVKARPAPPPAPEFSWTGFYVGGYVGGAQSDHSVTSAVPGVGFFDNNPFQSYGHTGTGFLAGGTIGANYQISRFVIGVELEGGYLDSGATTVVADTGDAGDQIHHRYRSYLVAGGRVGLAFDRLLVYGKGGAAWANVNHVEGDLDLPGPHFDPNFSYNVSKTLNGWAAGGGVEYAFTNNWTVKGEYLYLDFDSFTAFDAGNRGYIITNKIHTAKIGINYKFGGPIVAKY